MAAQVKTRLPRPFLDTNVLIHAEDPIDPAKRKKAIELVIEHRRQRTGVVSIQVLQEFFTGIVGKLKVDVAIARYRAFSEYT